MIILEKLIYLFLKTTMNRYLNIKINNADLPKPFIISNEWMDESRAKYHHWEANGYCAINKRYSCYWKHYNDIYNKIDIHWWLTFSESLANCKEEFPTVYEEYLKLPWTHNDDAVWIFWFDTAHQWDNPIDWSVEAVEREAKYLQKQLLQFYVPTQEDIELAKAD